jgi:GMP synthase-like glutamine amidotransferase
MTGKIGVAVIVGRPDGHFSNSYSLLKNIAHVKYSGKEQRDMHIGILVTNTDDSEFAKQRPLDGEKFKALLQPLRPDWKFTAVQVKDGEIPQKVDAFDGYVITGSPASTNGNEAWIAELFSFIRRIDAAKIPTVGVCFGHQAIAKALGGTVSKNPEGWGFGITDTHFTRTEQWMEPKLATISLYAAHNEQVTILPKDAVVLGGSKFCPVGSYKIGNHIFTTEYHPEMTSEFILDLSHAFEKYIGHDIAKNARAQFQSPAQGKIFAEWMVRFLEMPR